MTVESIYQRLTKLPNTGILKDLSTIEATYWRDKMSDEIELEVQTELQESCISSDIPSDHQPGKPEEPGEQSGPSFPERECTKPVELLPKAKCVTYVNVERQISAKDETKEDFKPRTQPAISSTDILKTEIASSNCREEGSIKMQISPETSIPVENPADTKGLKNSEESVRKRHKKGDKTLSKTKLSTLSLKSASESLHEKANVVQDVIQAFLVRALLFIHSCLCVWRTADVYKDNTYWLLATTNILLGIETFYTCFFRKGQDPKWICPCFLLYLLGTVPAIWLLQLDVLERKFNVNVTTNSSTEELSALYGVKLLPISLDAETWSSILQQLLLFVLVIGRMLLPRGPLTRDELSQTLFIFIGSGSDVMEFFVVFEDPVFYNNTELKYATLIIWSVSLLQFIFVIAVAKGPKRFRLGTAVEGMEDKHKHFGAELWGLLLSITFMDGPYVALRLYAIIVHKVLSFGILFFTCKNVLMLILLFYRLLIVVLKIKPLKREKATKNTQNMEFF